MEKLELHEIVGYLPYGLKCEILNYRSDYVGIKNSMVNGFYLFNSSIPHFTYVGGSTGKSTKEISFLLRPLSDLTKEIEVDGEKFVPLHNLLQAYCFNIDKMDLEEINSYSESLIEIDMSYQTAVMLYSWHFDIHNLINRGLAININEI